MISTANLLVSVLTSNVLVLCSDVFHLGSVITYQADAINSTYFGFSVILGDMGLIVGAPKAAARDGRTISPGLVFNCNLTNLEVRESTCEPIDLYRNSKLTGGTPIDNAIFVDDMWFGASIAILNHGTLVVCAPRMILQYVYKEKDVQEINGACYVITEENGIEELPLIDYSKISSEVGMNLYYLHGQAGMSIKVTDEGTIIIGAPGLFQRGNVGAGGVIDYQYNNKTVSVLNPTYLRRSSKVNYFGYSVESGDFSSSNKSWYVAAAPGSKVRYGQVVIIEPTSAGTFKEVQTLRERQMGSYFGASLCCVDVNGDGRLDLLVGAPNFKAKNLQYDQGAVYIYINRWENNRVNLILQSRKVLGSELDGAKFGSAIADMGDLDGDGYRDVAIGAPWENEGRGAVYIYRGGRKGINPDYIQKILAENVDNFGYAIAKGYDVDDNKCNDLAIGAINSDKVYLYRCIPSMEVNAKINKENIIFNVATFDVLFCVHARELPESPDVKITLKGQIVLDRRERRASISDDGVYDVTITPGEKICQNRTVNFKPTAELSRPIKIAFKLMALEVPELKSTHFSKHLARLSPKSKLFDYIGVQINQTAKQLLEMTLKPLNSTFVPGTDTSLGFEITVSNNGEPAYGAKVYTRLPISPNKIPDACALEDMELTCDIPEPLPSHESVSWKIELEFTQSNYTHDDDIIIAAKLIDFLSSINGSGDSTKEVIIAIRPKATFVITGIAQPNGSIAVSREALSKDESVVFEHYFTITNLGPSDWLKIPVRILIPEKVDLSNTIDGCSEDGDDLNCLWSLKSNDSQIFSLSFKFDLSSHGDYLDEITTFNATSAVMLLRNPNEMAYVTTTLVLDAKTPIWPLIVGIVVGLLTLLAASFGLYKLNFFKRTKREELKKLQEEPTGSDCTGNQSPGDNNDENKLETSAEYLNFE